MSAVTNQKREKAIDRSQNDIVKFLSYQRVKAMKEWMMI